MKLNKKGFTLIELLAVIVIIGLISGVAITGVMRYLDRTKDQAYEALEETLYSAAQNYIIDRGVLVPTSSPLTLESTQLISTGYIKELDDPDASSENTECTGYVKVTRIDKSGTKIDEYKYEVHLQCSNYNNTKTFNG